MLYPSLLLGAILQTYFPKMYYVLESFMNHSSDVMKYLINLTRRAPTITLYFIYKGKS